MPLALSFLAAACGAGPAVPLGSPPAPVTAAPAPPVQPPAPPTAPETTPPAPETVQPPAPPTAPETTPPQATRYPASAPLSPLTPSVASRIREIAARNPNLDDHRFLKAGGSGTVNPDFLACFAARTGPFYKVELGDHGALASTLDWFRPTSRNAPDPFARWSKAAEVGRTADWALRGKPSPLEAELAALHPRFAVVEFGTNDMVMGVTPRSALFRFADRLATLLDRLIAAGVVPVLTGVGPRAHAPAVSAWVPTYDAVMRALAEARQVPYVSLAVAQRDLPHQGLAGDGMHADALSTGTIATPCVLTSEGLRHGYNVRNRLTLSALDRLRATLFTPDAGPPTDEARAPLLGTGTAGDPFVIDGLPFSHLIRDKAAGPALYRLSVATPTPVRLIVLPAGPGGAGGATMRLIDAAGGDPEKGRKRADPRVLERRLDAGDYTLRVDVPAGPGLLLIAVACEPGDTDCR